MNITKISEPSIAAFEKKPDTKNVEEKSPNQIAISSDENIGIKKYEFTNITRGEFKNVINNLIKTGQMTLDESGSLLYAMGDQSILNGANRNMDNESVNVYDILNQSIAFNRTIGNDAGIIYDTKALDALIRFQNQPYSLDLKT